MLKAMMISAFLILAANLVMAVSPLDEQFVRVRKRRPFPLHLEQRL